MQYICERARSFPVKRHILRRWPAIIANAYVAAYIQAFLQWTFFWNRLLETSRIQFFIIQSYVHVAYSLRLVYSHDT